MANFTDLTFTQSGQVIQYDDAGMEYEQTYYNGNYVDYDGELVNDFVDLTNVSSNFTDLIGD